MTCLKICAFVEFTGLIHLICLNNKMFIEPILVKPDPKLTSK